MARSQPSYPPLSSHQADCQWLLNSFICSESLYSIRVFVHRDGRGCAVGDQRDGPQNRNRKERSGRWEKCFKVKFVMFIYMTAAAPGLIITGYSPLGSVFFSASTAETKSWIIFISILTHCVGPEWSYTEQSFKKKKIFLLFMEYIHISPSKCNMLGFLLLFFFTLKFN